jgi:hypothetical protein
MNRSREAWLCRYAVAEGPQAAGLGWVQIDHPFKGGQGLWTARHRYQYRRNA